MKIKKSEREIITKGNQKTDLEDENNQQSERNLIESSGMRKMFRKC